MKHTLKITLLIVALFLTAQLVGLVTVNRHIQVFEDVQTGAITIEHPDTLLGPPAEVKYKSASFLLIALLVLIGTGLPLLLGYGRSTGPMSTYSISPKYLSILA